MLSKPHYGWTSFTIGNFNSSASYLTDIPIDLLDFFLGEINIVHFDTEGAEFSLVRTIYSLFIIDETSKTAILCDFSNYKESDLAKELFTDLKENFNDWIYWNEDSDTNCRFLLLSHKIRRLKEKYNIE